jgi:drug/metabolite transporter (DMT)-like permease
MTSTERPQSGATWGALPQTNRGERLKAALVLLLVSVIWGSAFVVQRMVAGEIGVFLFNGLRFWIGAAVLLPLALREGSPWPWQAGGRGDRRLLGGLALAGVLLAGGAAFQQFGLRYTTAGNAGFVTGLYVVLIPVFLTVFWRQRQGWTTWAASLLAVAGLFLLSTGGRLALALGDSLEFAGAILWALHVILIGWLVRRVSVLRLAVIQYFVCGLLSTGLGLGIEAHTLRSLPGALWALLYSGVLSVGLGYTLQAVGQKHAAPADAALLLSAEAVFAALFGWLILAEFLSTLQATGCGLILAGMLLAQWPAFYRSRGGN